jgi:hypothetical protein
MSFPVTSALLKATYPEGAVHVTEGTGNTAGFSKPPLVYEWGGRRVTAWQDGTMGPSETHSCRTGMQRPPPAGGRRRRGGGHKGKPGHAPRLHGWVVTAGHARPPCSGCAVITGVTVCIPGPHMARPLRPAQIFSGVWAYQQVPPGARMVRLDACLP